MKINLQFILLAGCYLFSIGASSAHSNNEVDDTLPKPYTPFPSDSAEWIQSSEGFVMPTYWTHNKMYYLNGDTILNGKIYHQLFLKDYYTTNSLGFPFSAFSDGFSMGFREDSEKVYVYDTTEHLLYDFSNLIKGDSVSTWFNNNDFGYNPLSQVPVSERTVDSIGAFQMDDGGQRNAYVFSKDCGLASNTIVEGMGSTNGLLPFYGCPFEENYFLLCFKIKGKILYSMDGDTTNNCSYTYNGIKETNRMEVRIFPNPSSNYINLVNDNYPPATLRIYNSNGMEIKSTLLTQDNPSKMDIQSFAPGTYFVSITTGTQSVTGKFIKQ